MTARRLPSASPVTSVDPVGRRFPVTRRIRHAPLLAVLLSCATQQREHAMDRASGGEAAVIPASPPSSGPPPIGNETLRPASARIVNLAPGRFLLEADTPIEVAVTANLEHRSPQGEWVPTPFELRESCAPGAGAAPRCRTLLPGEPLVPLSWNGTSCGPCCDHQDPTPIEPGTYRLQLAACGGSGIRWEGPSFEMPSATDAVERWRAASNVQRVSLFRLGAARDDAVDAADDRYIGGYPIVHDSEVVLSDPMVTRLTDWLRAPAGFSDALMRRCFGGKRFGFRLERDVPQVGHERSELAIDLGCQSIVVLNQEGSLRSRSLTYFDSSREGVLAILHEAMPPGALGRR